MNEEEKDYDEDYTEDYEEEERNREPEPSWTEGYLNTLGMSMRDFL